MDFFLIFTMHSFQIAQEIIENVVEFVVEEDEQDVDLVDPGHDANPTVEQVEVVVVPLEPEVDGEKDEVKECREDEQKVEDDKRLFPTTPFEPAVDMVPSERDDPGQIY